MNSYSRGYGRRRYGAYRRRYGYGRTWRRNWYRYGSRAGAMQRNGRRSFTLSVPIDQIYTMTIAAGQSFSTILRTCPWYKYLGTQATTANINSVAQNLMDNAAYRMYTKLYDQVKIISVTHRVYICNPVGVSGGLPSMKVYTAWDRDMCKTDDVITNADLLNGPESQSQMFVTNSRAEFVRSIRATDLQERTTFHDCTINTDPNAATNATYDAWWFTHGASVGFSPSMSMGFEASDTNAADRSFQVSISSRYVVCFRNPKFGLSNYAPSNAKLSFGVKEEGKSDEKKVTFSDEVKKDVGDLGDDDVLMGDLPEIKEA